VQDLEANDIARLPWFVKRYAERLPCTPLPRELPATTGSAVAVLAGRSEVKPTSPDLPNLSRLLYLSAGVVRTMDRDYGIHPFRAAGSAGGRFPLELYVAVPPDGSLAAGVHWYDPLEPSPPPAWEDSATRSTARRTWPPGWPKAGCTWPPTRSAPARPG
jgi:hypothetical protein